MDGFASQTIHHADTERGKRIPGTALSDEETESLFDESVITLLEREIPRISGDGRPEQGRGIDGVMAGLALHQRKLASHIVLDLFEPVAVVTPCQHVAMRTDGGQPEAVRLIEIFLNPFTVDLVAAAVP